LRLPRDVSGDDLAKALVDLGYRITIDLDEEIQLKPWPALFVPRGRVGQLVDRL
jgi:hypothetical protein